MKLAVWLMRQADAASPVWARVGLLAAVMLLFGHGTRARAHDPDHPDVKTAVEWWGPLWSEIAPDAATLRVGFADGKPRPCALRVDESSQRDRNAAPLRVVQSASAAWHLLRVESLSPSRRYRYTLDCPDLSRFAGEFSTAPPIGDPRPLLLAVFGDEQASPNNDSVSSRSIVQAVLAEAPDLVVGTGDLVGEGGSKDDWRELSKTHQPLWSQLLYLPALGNHELLGDYDGSFFRRLLPQAESRFYAVRYGFLQLIFLDGNQPGSQPQTHFLATQLKSTQGDKSVRARIVVLHQPPLSVGLHCGTSGSMHEWMHIFEKYRVDAVLAGHDHAYERLERNGVPYFVTGGGGAKLYDQSPCGQPDEPALQRYESVHHYLMVELKPLADRVEISLRAQVPQGMPFDKVTLPLAPSAVGQIHKDSDEPGTPRRWHRGHLLYVLRHHGQELGVALVFGAVVVAAWRYGRRRSS
jgi:hypothetical protein